DNEGKPYALVARCRKEGVKLNYYCPEISKYLGKMNNELLQKLH
ncbi:MarR family transcriptional regulator, partial [Sulfolobus sp. A20-N-G8]